MTTPTEHGTCGASLCLPATGHPQLCCPAPLLLRQIGPLPSLQPQTGRHWAALMLAAAVASGPHESRRPQTGRQSLADAGRLEQNVITPTTKAEDHDEPLTPADIVQRGLMTQQQWDQVLYSHASDGWA